LENHKHDDDDDANFDVKYENFQMMEVYTIVKHVQS